MKLVIAITCFNAQEYIVRCLDSIKNQTYKNWVAYIIDDLSTDDSVNIIKEYIKDDKRFNLIVNTIKTYQAGNYDHICRDIKAVKNDDIIIETDIDDYLYDNNAFQKVINVYEDKNVWITNGSFQFIGGRMGFSSEVTDFSNLRHLPFTSTHLRTWKVFLWRAMNQNDMKKSNGEWYSISCDLIFFLGMLELAQKEHYKFIPDVLYVYNDENLISEGRIYLSQVNEMVETIKQLPPNNPLKIKTNRFGNFKRYLNN